MAANQSAAPIIIKKIKKGGHGHHGGAWKVAFADFVTAMMAFFLLMWLMASTTVEQRASISSYFNDPMAKVGFDGNGGGNPALNGGSGILTGRGKNPFSGQSQDEENSTRNGPDVMLDDEQIERARMVQMMDELKEVVDAGKALKEFADQILLDITPEGLRIQIVDKENRAMFDQGSARLQPYTRDILHEIVKVVSEAPNRISISGHTDATPYARNGDYGNWELSADRANAARRELLAGGLEEEKIGRVVGLGSSDLLDPSQPRAPINRRISIVVLRGDHGTDTNPDGSADGAPPPTAQEGEALPAPSEAPEDGAPPAAETTDGDTASASGASEAAPALAGLTSAASAADAASRAVAKKLAAKPAAPVKTKARTTRPRAAKTKG